MNPENMRNLLFPKSMGPTPTAGPETPQRVDKKIFVLIVFAVIAVGAWGALFWIQGTGNSNVPENGIQTTENPLGIFTKKHFGYDVDMTPEEYVQIGMECNESKTSDKFVLEDMPLNTPCSSKTNPRLWLGWRKDSFDIESVAQRTGNSILKSFSDSATGNFDCTPGYDFLWHASMRASILDCSLFTEGKRYYYSILFFDSEKADDISQTITIVSLDANIQDQDTSVPRKIRSFAERVRDIKEPSPKGIIPLFNFHIINYAYAQSGDCSAGDNGCGGDSSPGGSDGGGGDVGFIPIPPPECLNGAINYPTCSDFLTWTRFCNEKDWDWWEVSNELMPHFKYLGPGDGTCRPGGETWTQYCTGANDVNGNNWQWWEVSNQETFNGIPKTRKIGPGTGTCTPGGVPGGDGLCGSADQKDYPYGTTDYGSDKQCSAGYSTDSRFPTPGETVTWYCNSADTGSQSPSCSASQTKPTSCTPIWNGCGGYWYNNTCVMTCPADTYPSRVTGPANALYCGLEYNTCIPIIPPPPPPPPTGCVPVWDGCGGYWYNNMCSMSCPEGTSPDKVVGSGPLYCGVEYNTCKPNPLGSYDQARAAIRSDAVPMPSGWPIYAVAPKTVTIPYKTSTKIIGAAIGGTGGDVYLYKNPTSIPTRPHYDSRGNWNGEVILNSNDRYFNASGVFDYVFLREDDTGPLTQDTVYRFCTEEDYGAKEYSCVDIRINVAADPIGWFERAGCDFISGWTCDPNAWSTPLAVDIYDNGKLAGTMKAGVSREPGVGVECGNGTSAHGFAFTTPTIFKTGTDHEITVTARNIGLGKDIELLPIDNDPEIINCSIPICDVNVGNACYSTANNCGEKRAGTVTCAGTCSSAPLPDRASCLTCHADVGKSCDSQTNNCGQKNTGTVLCNGVCGVVRPPDSASCGACVPTVGTTCFTSANNCNEKNIGTMRCDGTCSALVAPPDRASCAVCVPTTGSTCVSAGNNCSTVNTGTIECDGSCKAVRPSDQAVCVGGTCTAETKDHCELPAQKCETGFSGKCNYSCSGVNWTKVNNTCVGGSIAAVPNNVKTSETSKIDWTSTFAKECKVTSIPAGHIWTGINGTKMSDPLTVNTSFILSCLGEEADPTNSSHYIRIGEAKVTVGSAGVPPVLTAPLIVKSGEKFDLVWDTNNGDETNGCKLTGGTWSINPLPHLFIPPVDPLNPIDLEPENGTTTGIKITARTTFTLTCGSLSDSKTVGIKPTEHEI